MIELIKKYRKYREYKNDSYIKWEVWFTKGDDSYQIYSFLPTIQWVPSYHRYYGQGVFDITWWKYHIGVGTHQRREKKDG